jgi:hypothetical protein
LVSGRSGLGGLRWNSFCPQIGRETRKALATGVDDGLEHLTAFGRYARKPVGTVVESGETLLARTKQQASVALDSSKKIVKRAA